MAQSNPRPQRALFVVLMMLAVGWSAPAGAGSHGPTPGERWVALDNAPGSGDEAANAMALLPNGTRIVVAGRTTDASDSDLLAAAIDAITGQVAWQARHASPGEVDDEGESVAVDASGRLAVVGGRGTFANGDPYHLFVAYDTWNGAVRWTRGVPTAGFMNSQITPAVAFSPDGSRVYAALGDPTFGYGMGALALNAATGAVLWNWQHPSDGVAGATGLAVAPDGSRLFVSGHAAVEVEGRPDRRDAAIAALNPSGALLWLVNLTVPGAESSHGAAVAVTPDGATVVLAGEASMTFGERDQIAAAYRAADGQRLWTFQADPGGEDRLTHAAASGGLAYVLGERDAASIDVELLALDLASGSPAWSRVIDGAGTDDDYPRGLALSADRSRVHAGAVVQTCCPGPGTYSPGWFALTVDAASGATVWERTWSPGLGEPQTLVALPQGVALAGHISGNSHLDALVGVLEDPAGALRWSRQVDDLGDATDYGAAMALSPDGRLVAMAGSRNGGNTLTDFHIVVRDALSGARRWAAYLDHDSRTDRLTDITFSPDGARVYAAGYATNATTAADVLAVAYRASDGQKLWERRWAGTGRSDEARAMAVSPDGSRLYLTGYSEIHSCCSNRYLLTMALDAATGAVQWTNRLDAPWGTQGEGYDVAVDADGNVYATGILGSSLVVRSLTAAGTVRFTSTFAHRWTTTDSNTGRHIAVAGGRVLVAGEWSHWMGPPSYSIKPSLVAAAFDATTGAYLWNATWGGVTTREPFGTAVASSDGAALFLAAHSDDGAGLALLALDGATGARSWERRSYAGYVKTAPLGLAAPPLSDLVLVGGTRTPNWNAYDTAYVGAYNRTTGEPGYVLTASPQGGRGLALVASADGERIWLGGDAPTRHRQDLMTAHFRPPDPPSAPRDLAASGGPGRGEVTLNWSPPEDDGGDPISAYRVFRDGVQVAEVAALSYTDSGLADGAAHAYTVRAVNGAGEGAPAGPVAGRSFALPGAPAGLFAEAGPSRGQVRLAWSAPSDDGGTPPSAYRIYRAPAGGVLELRGEVPSGQLTYSESGLADGSAWDYAVTAVNLVGEGAAATAAAAAPVPPAAPASPSALPGPQQGEVTVRWLPPSADGGSPVAQYRVMAGPVGGPHTTIALLGPSARQHVERNLAPGTVREYVVAAANDVGFGPDTAPVSVRVPARPSEPRNVDARPWTLPATVRVTWEAPADDGGLPVTGYSVYRAEGAGAAVLVARVDGATRAWHDLGRAPLVEYRYSVSATNAVGEGPRSAESCSNAAPWPGGTAGIPRCQRLLP